MKRLCFLVVLMAFSSSAHAGGSISFSIGGHRVHIDASRHCRATSCASVSVTRKIDLRRKRDRFDDDDRDATTPAKPAPQIVALPPPPPAAMRPAATPSAQTIAAPPPAVYKPAASETQIVAAPPPPPPPVQPVSIPLPPPPPVAEPAEPARPESQLERAEDAPADSPIGDWQTEGKGTMRIAKCGNALCGYVLNSASLTKGEAVLINMKPKTDRQWTGSVYSQDTGDTYYGRMTMKGINTLRVEACALWRFYCSGSDWSRTSGHAENLVTSRQMASEPRS